jgi:hypothetical protein
VSFSEEPLEVAQYRNKNKETLNLNKWKTKRKELHMPLTGTNGKGLLTTLGFHSECI